MNQALQVHEPEAPPQHVAVAITRAHEELKAVRTFIKEHFDIGRIVVQNGKKVIIAGLDASPIPGCGDKPALLLPGAQKATMYFNCYPTYKIRKKHIDDKGHVDIQVRCLLMSRSTREQAGEGVGSCSTMEKKYRWRGAERLCPSCGAPAIRRSDKEFYCWAKLGGCGAKFNLKHSAILDQGDGSPVENPELWDLHNTILKMAKKRAHVDAAMTLGCLSELFTQDIEDIYGPPIVQATAAEVIDGDTVVNGEVVEPQRPSGQPKPENKGLFGKEHAVKVDKFLAWVKEQVENINRLDEKGSMVGKWVEKWDEMATKWLEEGLAFPSKPPELINAYGFKGHLLKWAKATNRLAAGVEIENARSREAEAHLATIFYADKQAVISEMAEYLKAQRTEVMKPIYKKFPELAPDQYEDDEDGDEPDTMGITGGTPDDEGKDAQ